MKIMKTTGAIAKVSKKTLDELVEQYSGTHALFKNSASTNIILDLDEIQGRDEDVEGEPNWMAFEQVLVTDGVDVQGLGDCTHLELYSGE